MEAESIKTKSFEECLDMVEKEISKRRARWYYPHLEFEDVSQLLRIRLFQKWDKWDQSRPLLPWMNRVITRAILNILRDGYSNIVPPCARCPANDGGDACRLTPSRIQCSECKLYKEWEKKQKNAFNVKMPVSLEFHTDELYNTQDDSFDIEEGKKKLTKLLKKSLSATEYKVYNWLYIENRSEDYVAEKMHFITNEKGRKPGYRMIKNYKNQILAKSKEILKDGVEDL